MNLKEPNSRLTRWRLKLSEYDFTIIYKQGKANTNADALSRIEINNDEISSFIVNPTEEAPSLNDSRTITVPEVDDSKTITVHTDEENPILEVPITDDALNKFSKQLILTVVRDIKVRPVVTKPFETHTRISVQFSESSLEEDVINAIKEYVHPKMMTGVLNNPPQAMYAIVPIIQKTFKNSAMNLMISKRELENIREYLRQQDIIWLKQ